MIGEVYTRTFASVDKRGSKVNQLMFSILMRNLTDLRDLLRRNFSGAKNCARTYTFLYPLKRLVRLVRLRRYLQTLTNFETNLRHLNRLGLVRLGSDLWRFLQRVPDAISPNSADFLNCFVQRLSMSSNPICAQRLVTSCTPLVISRQFKTKRTHAFQQLILTRR